MENGDPAAIAFTWYGSALLVIYSAHNRLDRASDLPVVWADINYELACQLHNIACLHSTAGCMLPRDSLEVGSAFGLHSTPYCVIILRITYRNSFAEYKIGVIAFSIGSLGIQTYSR